MDGVPRAMWAELFDDRPMPHLLSSYLGSSFFVSRDLVQQRPCWFYEKALGWVNGTSPLPLAGAALRAGFASHFLLANGTKQHYGFQKWEMEKHKLETMAMERLWHTIFFQDAIMPLQPAVSALATTASSLTANCPAHDT